MYLFLILSILLSIYLSQSHPISLSLSLYPSLLFISHSLYPSLYNSTYLSLSTPPNLFIIISLSVSTSIPDPSRPKSYFLSYFYDSFVLYGWWKIRSESYMSDVVILGILLLYLFSKIPIIIPISQYHSRQQNTYDNILLILCNICF